MKNEGRAGYEISIPGVSIGDADVVVSGRMSSLDKHGRMFCEVDVEQNDGLMIGGLFDLMREKNIDDVALSIFYRDFDQNWYVTDFKLMRNVYVSGGLEITDVSQRRSAGRPQQSPLDKGWPARLLQD